MIINRPNKHYTYILYEGLTPVYVGKGTNGRMLDKRDFDYDGFRIVMDGLKRKEAFELEGLIIEEYGHNNLYNNPNYDTQFKEGNKPWNTGKEVFVGKDNPFYGKKHNQATINKIIASNKRRRKCLTKKD